MKTVAGARAGAGFTLIELMITVAIIAILAAIAIPAYDTYLIRTQVSEGFQLAAGPKIAVEEYYANYGNWPSTDASVGLTDISGKYVSHVYATANPGQILIHFDSTGGQQANVAISGLQLGLSAIVNNGSISWSCTNRNINGIPLKYLPTSCR